jgi:hypothetical protein
VEMRANLVASSGCDCKRGLSHWPRVLLRSGVTMETDLRNRRRLRHRSSLLWGLMTPALGSFRTRATFCPFYFEIFGV